MIYALSLVFVLVGFGYLLFTLALSRKKKPLVLDGPEPRRFFFVVPALNEELVIGTTVDGLLAACTPDDRVLVVDDGSTDATAAIVRTRMSDPRVLLFQRTLPDAKVGKGQALNAVYRKIRADVLAEGLDPNDVVLCIVDADGRVEPSVLASVAPYFRDRRVGAVQLLVRIRNRDRWLTRFQDYEFLLFSALTQTAREKLGSVGLGGNGQFTRLAALTDLGDDPWSDCLTEDLDLGVRLAIAGWHNRFCGEAYVDQQGLTSVRQLVRQRTRWAQGHFQCWKLVPKLFASHLPTVTVYDLSYYLLAPGLVLLAPMLFTAAFVFFAVGVISYPQVWLTPFGLVYVLLQYLLAFGPAVCLMGLYWRRSRDLSLSKAFLMAHLIAVYNWIWYIAQYKAVARILLRRKGWTKTGRTAEETAAPLVADDGFWGEEDAHSAHSAYADYRRQPLPDLVHVASDDPAVRSAAHPSTTAADFVLRDNYDDAPIEFIASLPTVPAPKRS